MQLLLAVVDGVRTAPAPGLAGECLLCGKPMIAKCGPIRVRHWAHIGKRSCDPWWENQTPWHQAWKAEFPEEYREVGACDAKGERHIADVRLPHGLCIEFQRSHLHHLERPARETFYGPNLVWIVDGTRLKRDLKRFFEGKPHFRRIANTRYFFVQFPEECLPQDWLNCRSVVFFDFHGAAGASNGSVVLWGLLPGRVGRSAILVAMSRRNFIEIALKGPQIASARWWLARIAAQLDRHRVTSTSQKGPEVEVSCSRPRRPLRPWRPKRRWRQKWR